MNIKELIERIEGLKNLFGNKAEYIEIDTVIELVSELHEPQKPVVKQFVADWYEKHKDDFEGNLFRCIDQMPDIFEMNKLSEFEEWLIDEHTAPFQTLVNMHQFGYTVEKERKYTVKVKATLGQYLGRYYLNNEDLTPQFTRTQFTGKEKLPTFTRKELEQTGFGWVFDCPGIEIEEVEG